MSSFDIILIPTDFSEDSDQAFQIACSVAREQFASLVVVHVLPRGDCPDGDSDVVAIDEDSPVIRNCREQFQRMNVEAGDIPISFRIVYGHAVGEILNVAHEEHADLIVIASHRQFHVQLHGSVAEGLLRQTHCPVVCLKQPVQGSKPKASSLATAKST